jgi:uncharacterized lipoprotein YmbA
MESSVTSRCQNLFPETDSSWRVLVVTRHSLHVNKVVMDVSVQSLNGRESKSAVSSLRLNWALLEID